MAAAGYVAQNGDEGKKTTSISLHGEQVCYVPSVLTPAARVLWGLAGQARVSQQRRYARFLQKHQLCCDSTARSACCTGAVAPLQFERASAQLCQLSHYFCFVALARDAIGAFV